MNKPEIILIGAGGHARSCIDVVEQAGEYVISGLIGLPDEVGQEILGYKVIGTDDDLQELKFRYDKALIAVGQIRSPEIRIKLFSKLKALGFSLPYIISSTAYVSQHSVIGNGTIIMHGARINAGVKIGNNCIINSNALIEHDCNIADDCHVSTGVILNGGVYIDEGCFLGSGSILFEGLKIGRYSVVGAGLVIRKSCPDNTKISNQV